MRPCVTASNGANRHLCDSAQRWLSASSFCRGPDICHLVIPRYMCTGLYGASRVVQLRACDRCDLLNFRYFHMAAHTGIRTPKRCARARAKVRRCQCTGSISGLIWDCGWGLKGRSASMTVRVTVLSVVMRLNRLMLS